MELTWTDDELWGPDPEPQPPAEPARYGWLVDGDTHRTLLDDPWLYAR